MLGIQGIQRAQGIPGIPRIQGHQGIQGSAHCLSIIVKLKFNFVPAIL